MGGKPLGVTVGAGQKVEEGDSPASGLGGSSLSGTKWMDMCLKGQEQS